MNVFQDNGRLRDGIAYLISGGTGVAMWLFFTAFSDGDKAAWNDIRYFTYGWPVMILAAGLFGFLAPDRPWRWAVTMTGMQQLSWWFLAREVGNLVPITIMIFIVLSAPCIFSAYLGARFSRHR